MTSGAAQLLFSTRATRQISLPVALSSATMNDSPSWSKTSSSLSSAMTGPMPSPKAIRIRNWTPKSFFQTSVPLRS